jgi:hypothetical protein
MSGKICDWNDVYENGIEPMSVDCGDPLITLNWFEALVFVGDAEEGRQVDR